MKSIINGKRYDSETAVLVGRGCYNGPRTDFQWWDAGLYKTPRAGRFFLAGEGGGLSVFKSHLDGGGFCEGSGIVPLTATDALTWAEQELDPEAIEEHFGDLIEDA